VNSEVRRPKIPFLQPGLVLAGSLVLGDGLLHLAHLDGVAAVGVGALAGGWWLLSGRRRPATPRLPATIQGWLDRCESVLQQFDRLEAEPAAAQPGRRLALARLEQERLRTGPGVALVGSRPMDSAHHPQLAAALRSTQGLRLLCGHALPASSADWCWPEEFEACDAFLYQLQLPLQAADLRWLESIPAGLPLWLLIEIGSDNAAELRLAELQSQWSGAAPERLLLWDGGSESLAAALSPMAAWLSRQIPALRQATALRRLERLHGRWQAELEQLRRREWQKLQQRTQWLVAAGVFANPLPTVDLLVLTAANGLMLQEMARLWDCPWDGEQLRAAATELGRAALTMGVVEWSSQALAAAVKLHGATWLVGGTLQALSAAYLTRVVGHAMADMLALSAGVSEPDLEAIKRQAPLLVARAAEAEKLDWNGFLQQGLGWIQQQLRETGSTPMLDSTS